MSVLDVYKSLRDAIASSEDLMLNYTFWNNKGGTGKTSLIFQSLTTYAELHPEKRILAIDLCPQANLSELLLGGLNNHGSDKLLERHGLVPRCSIGGYFQLRLPSPYAPPSFNAKDFITKPSEYNSGIPTNVDLVCGDPLLELQANAVSTLANQNIPGTDAWVAVIDWLNLFIDQLANDYDVVFMDCNPSFSLYTQIALATTDRLILPVMADDSSRRAIQNAFSLIYGLKLPSEIYSSYAFATKLSKAGRKLPQVHLIVRNRITQYMKTASAYEAVLAAIEKDIETLLHQHPEMFSFTDIKQGSVEVRDFQTSGVVAFAKGLPFTKLPAGKQTVNGRRVQVKQDYLTNSINAVNELVSHL